MVSGVDFPETAEESPAFRAWENLPKQSHYGERVMVPARKRKLLSTEREGLICRSLAGGVKTVAELSAVLEVSEATVRRDLEQLESRGKLYRVHGGAALPGSTGEPVYEEKANFNTAHKQSIARKAISFIHESDTIFLDGGSTVLELAKSLPSVRDLTIVTNSLMAAAELMEKDCRLILTGGEFRKLSRTLVGPLSGRILTSLHISKAFLGTLGIDLESGISTTDPNEAYTKELVMRCAEQVFVLADSSKVGVPSFASSGSLEDIDVLITDPEIPPSAVKFLRNHKIEVIY